MSGNYNGAKKVAELAAIVSNTNMSGNYNTLLLNVFLEALLLILI